MKPETRAELREFTRPRFVISFLLASLLLYGSFRPRGESVDYSSEPVRSPDPAPTVEAEAVEGTAVHPAELGLDCDTRITKAGRYVPARRHYVYRADAVVVELMAGEENIIRAHEHIHFADGTHEYIDTDGAFITPMPNGAFVDTYGVGSDEEPIDWVPIPEGESVTINNGMLTAELANVAGRFIIEAACRDEWTQALVDYRNEVPGETDYFESG